MDLGTIDFFLFYLILTGALLGLPIVFFYLLHKYLSKRGYSSIFWIILSIVIGCLIFCINDAINPKDSFYYSEFKELTLREIPASASIIKKDASYPDFRGEYCSVSLIKLSEKDYSSLLQAISTDKRLKVDDSIGNGLGISEEFDRVMGKRRVKDIKQGFTRKLNDRGKYLYIGFLNDHNTIVVYASVT